MNYENSLSKSDNKSEQSGEKEQKAYDFIKFGSSTNVAGETGAFSSVIARE